MQDLKVLLVDDHPIMREGLCMLLSEVPFIKSVDCDEDGQYMVERLKENSNFDLILMDVRMPRMNGIEATQHVTENYPDIKVLVLSTYDDESHILDILRAGA